MDSLLLGPYLFLDHKTLISGAVVFKCSSETSKMHYTKWFHFVVCGFYHCYGDGFDLYLKPKRIPFWNSLS